jgi:hypothetical protein
MKLKKWEIKRLKKLVKKLDKVKLEMEEDVVPVLEEDVVPVLEEYIITNGLPEIVKDIEKPQVGDIGFFWDEGQHPVFLYGVLENIYGEDYYPYSPANSGGNRFTHFSKIAPKLI